MKNLKWYHIHQLHHQNNVENKAHKKISHPAESLNVKNEMLSSEIELQEGKLVVSQILDEIIGNALQMSRKN